MKKKILITKRFLIYIFLLSIELFFALFPRDIFVLSQRIMLGFICAICIYLGFKQKFILNPYFCFVLTPFSLMIYTHTVSPRFLTELDNVVYIVAICSFWAFLAGLDLYVSKIRSIWHYDNGNNNARNGNVECEGR